MQADYILRIGEKHIFEVGAKGILRQVNSDYSYLSAEGTGEFFVDPSRPAGTLDYAQDIAAAYVSYTLALPNTITVKGGLRYEKTMLNATQDGNDLARQDYDNLYATRSTAWRAPC